MMNTNPQKYPIRFMPILRSFTKAKLASIGNMQHSPIILTLFSVARAVYPAYRPKPGKTATRSNCNQFAADFSVSGPRQQRGNF
jgi:hypothetical protein